MAPPHRVTGPPGSQGTPPVCHHVHEKFFHAFFAYVTLTRPKKGWQGTPNWGPSSFLLWMPRRGHRKADSVTSHCKYFVSCWPYCPLSTILQLYSNKNAIFSKIFSLHYPLVGPLQVAQWLQHAVFPVHPVLLWLYHLAPWTTTYPSTHAPTHSLLLVSIVRPQRHKHHQRLISTAARLFQAVYCGLCAKIGYFHVH